MIQHTVISVPTRQRCFCEMPNDQWVLAYEASEHDEWQVLNIQSQSNGSSNGQQLLNLFI